MLKMILNIHSDALYLSEPQAKSRVTGHFFLVDIPQDNKPIMTNGNIFNVCAILKFVVRLAAEAELGALFINAKAGKFVRLILQELGHPQPATPIHCDNNTPAGIANDTMKKHRSRSMGMRFFWITYQVKRSHYDVKWHPGQEHLADYFTKAFTGKHHLAVYPWYLHEGNTPRALPRAAAPATLKGCVETLHDGSLSLSLSRVFTWKPSKSQ